MCLPKSSVCVYVGLFAKYWEDVPQDCHVDERVQVHGGAVTSNLFVRSESEKSYDLDVGR